MLAQDKKIFSRKEINEKYSELWEGKKKSLSIDQLKDYGEKYKMKNIIVRDRKGVDHILFNDFAKSITQVKREEVTMENQKDEI